MKIDYKILWLDDQIDTFIDDEHIEEIENFLDEEGFEVAVDTVDNEIDFFNKLDDSYDLILTDYHMENMNGDKVVEAIREQSIFTEILFYTARADLKDTQMLDRISFLETNSSQADHEEAVVERTKELINLTIKKFQDIVVMRGMIMHETSDLDTQKIDILKNYIDKTSPELVDSLKLEILDELNEHFSSKLGKINTEWKTNNNGFKNLIKDNFVFSSAYKIKTLGWILRKLSETDFSNDYDEEIIKMRNQFAHANLLLDENGRKYFKKENQTFDALYCKSIRQNIRKHRYNLKLLKDKVDE